MKINRTLFSLMIGLICSGCFGVSESGNDRIVANERSAVNGNVNPTADPNADQAKASTPPAGSFAERANRRKPLEVPVSGTPIPLTFTEAGEDSQVASTMDKDGSVREIRIFRSHPILSKVELIWLTPKDKVLKITLKNGKTVETQTDGIENLKQATTGALLSIAGISPSAR